jgi:hypothetical protein
LEALQRTEAAQGSLNSSQADAAAMSYGQNFESQYFNNYEQMLAQLSGANFGPGNAGSVYASGAGASNQAGAGLFGNLLSAGSNLFGSGAADMTGTSAIGAAGADAAGSAGAATATDLGSGGLGSLLDTLSTFAIAA